MMTSSYSCSVCPITSLTSMARLWAIFSMLIVISTVISARPADIIQRQKRQSDQRLAELETLLALQKYNGHRVRGWQSHNDLSPGFGLIDFDKIGRRKKSTRFSPGNPKIMMGPEGFGDSSNNDDDNDALWSVWRSSVKEEDQDEDQDSSNSRHSNKLTNGRNPTGLDSGVERKK